MDPDCRGDGASKGAQEVMQALALIDGEVPDWRYVCKVWPQSRTDHRPDRPQTCSRSVVSGEKVISRLMSSRMNWHCVSYSACDHSTLRLAAGGFGMIQVEANACERPVIAIDAMAFLRHEWVHGENGILAKVAEERKITEATHMAKVTTTKVVSLVLYFQIRERPNTAPACPISPNNLLLLMR